MVFERQEIADGNQRKRSMFDLFSDCDLSTYERINGRKIIQFQNLKCSLSLCNDAVKLKSEHCHVLCKFGIYSYTLPYPRFKGS
jgi:hypothetical protein